MLVPFVIDAESLALDLTWSPTTLRACHHQLLEAWERAGLLVHDGKRFEDSTLNRAILDLPQNLRLLWQAMLARSPPVPCTNDWDGSVSRSRVQDLCSFSKLALVDDIHAEVEFEFTADQDEIPFNADNARRFVVCRLQAVQRASVVQEAYAIAQRNIEIGERYQDIWSSRFCGLASAPSSALKKVAIVDRYAMERHFRCPQDQLSGLERFLRLLDEDAGGPRYVTLYSARTSEPAVRSISDIETEMHTVFRRLPKKKVKRLTVHMVPNNEFGSNARDRYIRFGSYVWELGHGLDIFEGPAARHLCQASLKSDATSHLNVERALMDKSKTYKMDIPTR